MEKIPKEIKEAIRDRFNFPEAVLAAVVSTHKEEGISSRTMRIYDFDAEGCPILLTYVGNKKWEEMKKSPSIAICLVSDDKLFQIRIEGTAELESSTQKYWEMTRPDIKDYYLDKATNTHPVTDTMGLIRVRPKLFETLDLVIPYADSLRYQYDPSSSGWTKQKLSL